MNRGTGSFGELEESLSIFQSSKLSTRLISVWCVFQQTGSYQSYSVQTKNPIHYQSALFLSFIFLLKNMYKRYNNIDKIKCSYIQQDL